MKVLVVILTSNHTCYALRAYKSVKEQRPVNFEYDVIINVNSLNTNYFKDVKNAFQNFPVKVVETESNGKPGKGHNSVLELFKQRPNYSYLIMLDGDDMFYPCAFQQLEQLLQKKPDIDVGHLMINDNITTNDNDKKRIKLNGNYFLYTSANLQQNWWDHVSLKDPFNDPIQECRTPSRLIIASRRIFDSNIPIIYSEKCSLYDDFLAFLSWAEASYKNTLNVYSLSDPLIYCYNGQNDDSATYKFSKNYHKQEQKIFDEETKHLNALRFDWYNKLKQLSWVKLEPPNDFPLEKRIEFANKEFVEFEIKDCIKHAKENQQNNNFIKSKKFYQNAERGGFHHIDVKLNLAFSYHKLNLLEKAINSYHESIQIKPTFIAYRNLTMIYIEKKQYRLAQQYLILATNFPEATEEIYKTQFASYENLIKNYQCIKPIIKQKQFNKKPILCIYTGYSPPFNGKNYQERNVWGSEIAVVHLAELFAEKYQVYVFCVCDQEIQHNNVNYLHFNKFETFQSNYHINIMIVSRFINFFMTFRINADKMFYWAHDARIHDAFQGNFLENQGSYLFHNMLDKIDGIICVSQWHKEYFMKWVNIPEADRHKIHIIRNGIDINYFDYSLPKKNNRMIWASNPDRGLDILLKCYPYIKEKIKDLSLDIYYSDLKGEKMHPDRYKFIVEQVRNLPDVTFHGKISEKQLCHEFCKADIMPYFNRSHETYCISALQACAGGCVVVSRNFSGLKDSVSTAGYLLNGNVDDPDWQKKATKLIINLLNDPIHKEKVQNMAREWGKINTWKNRSDKWFKLFNDSNI